MRDIFFINKTSYVVNMYLALKIFIVFVFKTQLFVYSREEL